MKKFTFVKTPCIGVCSTGIGDDVCRGCKRYKHEVIDWNAYAFQQQKVVESRLANFLSQTVQNYWLIIDETKLRWQLQQQPIEVPWHRDLYCQLYVLVDAGASQMKRPGDFGFMVRKRFENLSLRVMCETIDRDFYALSKAHYACYFEGKHTQHHSVL